MRITDIILIKFGPLEVSAYGQVAIGTLVILAALLIIDKLVKPKR